MKIFKRCFQIALFLLLCIGIANITEAKSKEEIEKDIVKIDEWIKYWNDQIPRIKSKEKILIPAPSRYWKNKSIKDIMDFRNRNWPKIEIYDNKPFSTVDRADYVRRFKEAYGRGEDAKRGWMKIVDRSERMAIDIKIIRIPNANEQKNQKKRELAAMSTSTTVSVDKKEKEPTKYSKWLGREVVTEWKGNKVYYCHVHLKDGEDAGWPRSSGNTAENLDNVIKARMYHPEYTILAYTRDGSIETIIGEYRPKYDDSGTLLGTKFITNKSELSKWEKK